VFFPNPQSANESETLQDLIKLKISDQTNNEIHLTSEDNATQHLLKLKISDVENSMHPTPNYSEKQYPALNSSTQSIEIPTLSLQTSHVTQNTNHLPGLLNPFGRNLCFANSSIQALRPIFCALDNPDFAEHCLYASFLQLVQDMIQSTQLQSVNPLLSAMTTSQFQDGQQHDAAEFIYKLLEQLHEDTVMYSQRPDIIDSTFRIMLSDNEKGVVCSHRSREDRPLWCLPLPLNTTVKQQDVNSLLQNLLKKVPTIPKSCVPCQIQHSMLEYCVFEVLPRVLIIQLGRFLSNGDKINMLIGIPDTLKIQARTTNNTYQLKAIVKHYGTSRQGHYTTVTKDIQTQVWTEWNDGYVTRISAKEAITHEAYILIYTKE